MSALSQRAGSGDAKSVAVLGGGIAGLASAYYLVQAGLRPVVFESSDQLGGLGTHFEHRGVTLDRFYHVILNTDDDLVGLLRELGAEDRLLWRETGMGFRMGGQLYGFNTPLDLLRFGALPFLDRLRTGFAALYITKLKRKALDLDRVYAHEWLRQLFGSRVFERIWEPLLRAKFGERLERVPAYWVWNTLTREKNGEQEVKGYLRSGYRGFAELLRDGILARGGEIRMRTSVEGVTEREGRIEIGLGGRCESFDAAISTLPLPLLKRVAHGPLADEVPLPRLDYQGCVNALVISSERLERYYWTVVVDRDFPFQGVVETTHVIPPESIGGRHLVYVMNYCDQQSATYNTPDEIVKQQAVDGLARLYPRFRREAVEDVYVFRAPHVEPVWTVGYLEQRPKPRVGSSRLYLSTTAQAYPRVTAWNTSIGLARETVHALTGDLS